MADRGARSAHADHDPLVIAAWIGGDADAEPARAGDLAASCADCRRLADDLRAIRAASAVLPVPPRTRDFRLTPEDAARARHGRGWLGRLTGATGSPGLRPLAGAMTALGMAGLLLTALPLGPAGSVQAPGSGGGTTRDTAAQEVAGATPAASLGAAPPQGSARVEGLPAAGASDPTAQPVSGTDTDLDESGTGGPESGVEPGGAIFGVPGTSSAEGTPEPGATGTRPVPDPAAEPFRAAVAGASAVVLAGGVTLLVLTRRRARDG